MIQIITSKVIFNHPVISGKVTIVKSYYYDMIEITDLIDYINSLIIDNQIILHISIKE